MYLSIKINYILYLIITKSPYLNISNKLNMIPLKLNKYSNKYAKEYNIYIGLISYIVISKSAIL